MEYEFAKLETLLTVKLPNQIESIRKNTVENAGRIEEAIKEHIVLEKVQRRLNEYRQSLLDRVQAELSASLRDMEVKSLAFCSGNMDLFTFLTSSLSHVNGFNSFRKIKYINLMRIFSYDDDALITEPLAEDYNITSVILLSLHRVFVYLTSAQLDLDDLMQIKHYQDGVFETAAQKTLPKRNVFGPNVISFSDKIVILYKPDEFSYNLELIDSTSLQTVKSITIKLNMEYFDCYLMSNYSEIVVDMQCVHCVFDAELTHETRLGQNLHFNEPFFNGDKELIHISTDKLFYKSNALHRLKLTVMSRADGLTLYSFIVPFVKDYNRLDSILVIENESRFVIKSYSANNIYLLQFNGNLIYMNRIKQTILNNKNIYSNYRTYLKDRKYSKLEHDFLFSQFSALYRLKKIFIL